MSRAKTTETFLLADPHGPTSCAQANAGRSPESGPGLLRGSGPDAGYTRKAGTSRFDKAPRAPPGIQVPGSEPRAAPRSTGSYEIGGRRSRASFCPASRVPQKEAYFITRKTNLKPNLSENKIGRWRQNQHSTRGPRSFVAMHRNIFRISDTRRPQIPEYLVKARVIRISTTGNGRLFSNENKNHEYRVPCARRCRD